MKNLFGTRVSHPVYGLGKIEDITLDGTAAFVVFDNPVETYYDWSFETGNINTPVFNKCVELSELTEVVAPKTVKKAWARH